MIEHRNIHQSLVRLKLKSELLLHSFIEGWRNGAVSSAWLLDVIDDEDVD